MIKDYWNKFKTWHGQLESRERRMVNIGGSALITAIFYFGIWSPFLGRIDELRSRMGSEQKTLAWMQEADQKIARLSGGGASARETMTPVAMLALLQKRIQQAGMKDALSDMKQAANDSIQLQFKSVSFDKMMKLLIAVIKENHVTITQFSAIADTAPGTVNADIVLSLN